MTDDRIFRDRYGFFFWLRWILWFAGSFVLAAMFWTYLIKRLFGAVEGTELTLTWIVSVFGSWFMLVIPFMRKKEQIWKRLNTDQEHAVDAWLLGMGVFIGSLVVSALIWSLVFRARLHPAGGMDPAWGKAVFGSWLILLIPFLILMYRKADAIFQTANSRQTYEPDYRRLYIEPSRRMLPEALASRLATTKPLLPGGHLAHLKLKDGRIIRNVFILKGREVAGIYDYPGFDFELSQVVDLELVRVENLPLFESQRWLRFDVPRDWVNSSF